MPAIDERETITLTLPKTLVRQLDEEARNRKSTREREAEFFIADGFRRQQAARESFDRLSAMYRARLEREGKLNQTEEEIWEELDRIREEVANSYYPPGPSGLSNEEWEQLADELGSDIDPSIPALSEEAVARASFYEGRY